MAEETETKATQGETVRRQRRVAQVVSTHGDKTIRVLIDNLVKHPKYGKYMHRRTKLAVHDPANAAKMGDIVEIVPCRRISKSKSWRLVQVIRAGSGVEETTAQS
jgi:small subunit ribosomal protein S17